MQFPLTACPGLFYNTLAQDGFLCRLRIPGGMINSQQFEAIADISDHYGGGYIDITNRANIQIREIKQGINIQVLEKLQALGLASTNASVDHIRNIMTSPTAGIDTQELIDTRPLVKAWEKYITAHSHLSQLSAKFSVCFDGGGKISLKDRPNDIILAAELINSNIHWRLYLSYGEKGEPAKDTGILLKPVETIAVLAALAETYLKHIDINNRCKPRLREIINHITIEKYLHQVKEELEPNTFNFEFNLEKPSLCVSASLREENLIGIHSQKQSGLYYIGIVLPLGRLETYQIRGLANLAKRYGDDNIRLTPWQNLILSDIPQNQIIEVEKEITNLDLNYSPTDIKSFLVACSGKRGCAAAATETKDDALDLAKYLENLMILDCSVNIHFSGCSKSCAQHTQADITLLGVAGGNFPGYQIYVLGHLLYEYVTLAKVPMIIQQILAVYQQQRLSLQESFSQFIDRQKHQLNQLFSKSSPNSTVTILKYHV
ncbi:precorrin-3B synthase [Dolichospermum flos-aquae]|uniref:Precorrin-3B synthase n=1 Tax=Dolichospermum flos-aquae LEGE 04289 TaxID=1828708 RepID=A0ACC5Q1B9_DOLFA|nr:precorrin-3B synthase [Dolichospermum flos-aquae]MBE9219273.1 precorrin-3B synthase [Dolichospermum flos-aquae LEGE 04289]